MPTIGRIAAIEARLQSYHDQMTAVSEALGALRSLADAIIEEMRADTATIAAVQAEQSEAQSTDEALAVAPMTDPVAAGEPDTMVVAEIIEQPAAALNVIDLSDYRFADLEADAKTTPSHTAVALDEATAVAVAALAAAAIAAAEKQTSEKPVSSDPAGSEQVDAAPAGEIAPAAKTTSMPDAIATSKVVDVASRRRTVLPSAAFRQRATAAVASMLLVASATIGVHGALNTEMGQRLLELGTCDAELTSANRDCALLGWLLL